jgi:UDP-2-acetamido-2-deoxy-ribo-hexuluronate aminotransferase
MTISSPDHLILDSSVGLQLCSESKESELVKKLHAAKEQGVRIWFYVGEYSTLVGDLNRNLGNTSSPEDASLVAPRRRLEEVLPGVQWLSALSHDIPNTDDSDPIATALTHAADRLAGSAWVLTYDECRVKKGVPFALAENFDIPHSAGHVPFVDLGAQQDRIRGQIEERMHRVLHHGRYVMGEEIAELESELTKMSGAAHCICVSSGTDALLAALMAIGIKPGDEVITSPFTFFATAETIVLLGGVPVYVDIDPETFNLDPDRIEDAVSPRTRAIMPVSLYGQCAEMDDISTIARRHSLVVIEDAAQSFGARFHGRSSCALSELACTSFFPAKPLGAYGDGGACFTQDAATADRLRQIRDHGQQGRYHHTALGINGRLDTIQAAILSAKLTIFEDEISARQCVADRYAALLADLASAGHITLPVLRPYNTSAWAQYTIRVRDREQIQKYLAEQGIPSAVHYPTPLYDQPALAQSIQDCPESDRAAQEVLSLPMHPYLDDAAQVRVSNALYEAFADLPNTLSQTVAAEG